MDMNYSIGLNVLLKHLAITPLLDRAKRHAGLRDIDRIFPVQDFALGCQEEYPHYSYNECENIYRKLFGVLDSYNKDKNGVFYLFRKIANEALKIEGSGISCNHSDLLAWRETVHSVGQSIFICAFLAYEDFQRNNTRVDFAFSPCAPSDNMRLRNMLSLGMAENHFHLKGSAPAFLMSWVCLMNHIANRNSTNGFAHKDMKTRFFRSPAKDENLTLCESTQIAAHIRLWLNKWLNNFDNANDIHHRLSQNPHTWVSDVQREINVERLLSGANKLDYASNIEDISEPYAPISGEHRFLYRMFYEIYSNKRANVENMHLPFFVYLLSFMRLRAELVQSNNAVGFFNFEEYQKRKDIFLDNFPKYKTAYIKMALDSALRHNFITSLEARYYPNPQYNLFYRNTKEYWRMSSDKKTALYKLLENMKEILPGKQLDNILHEVHHSNIKDKCMEKQLFFVAFLVKSPDKTLLKGSIRKKLEQYAPIYSRHYFLQRDEYAKQIENIIRLRQSREDFGQRLYGIDACNHEVHARPEVFAHLFRKARCVSSHIPYSELMGVPLAKLRITYHVGEDFFDIVSGMRAIDEAIKFLELSHGDRLGHALALGIEPSDFYTLKNRRLFLSRQELLDNLTWLSHSLHKYGLFDSVIETWIYQKIEEHFQWLYRSNIPLSKKYHSISTTTYVNSWCLRGDNPKYYRNIKDDDVFLRNIQLANAWDLLQDHQCIRIREKDIQARQLMHHYHYNANVRINGEVIVELDIPEGYVEVIRALQDAMLEEICRMGIGIETNPSSNYLIGTFRQYHKHPIVRFYNRWLVPSSKSPQAFVSINTDDQGVFDTDLENEYALMASALENAKDDNGHPVYNATDILNWLDDIRRMGLEQSFMLTHRNLTEGR